MSVYVLTVSERWQPRDLHLILRSVWEWGAPVPELPAGGSFTFLLGGKQLSSIEAVTVWPVACPLSLSLYA